MAAITSAVVVAGATAYSANKQSKAAKQAGQMGAQAAQDSNQLQWNMYQQSRQDAEPWRQAGLYGLGEYMKLLGAPTSGLQAANQPQMSAEDYYLQQNPDVAASGMTALEHYNRYGRAEGRPWGVPQQQVATPSQESVDVTGLLRNTPGYQFRMQEGQRALESGAAANGGLFSGKAGKALVQYGQGVADQTYNDTLNRYAALSGIGQTQTQANAQYGQQVTQNMGNNLQTAAAQRASGLQQSAQAQGQGAQALAGAFGYGLNAWAQNRGGR